MDQYPFNFRDIRVEKANAISRYSRIRRITTLFRLVELLIFLIVVSRFSNHFAFSLRLSSEYLKGISVTLISPRFVFLLGNTIVVVLFLKSGRFSSSKDGEKTTDLYEEYVEKCRKNVRTPCSSKYENKPSDARTSKYENKPLDARTSKYENKPSDARTYNHGLCQDEKKIQRSRSEKLARVAPREVDHCRRGLRRSMTGGCRKIVEKPAITKKCSYKEDEMSSDEFRRTVEAFIARQQRVLREE